MDGNRKKMRSHRPSKAGNLPTELLLPIFWLCVEQDRDDSEYDCFQENLAPWNLSRVCREWRTVVIDKPEFWTQLSLVYQPTQRHPAKHVLWKSCVHMVSLCLSRSRNQEVVIRMSGERWETFAHLSELVGVLTRHSGNWKTFEVIDDDGSFYRALLEMPSLPLRCPRLERLSIMSAVRDEWDSAIQFPRLLDTKASPKLKKLSLRDIHPCALGFPWWQLDSLHLANFDEDFILLILPRLRSLCHLSLEAFSYRPASFDTHTLPNLKELSLRLACAPINAIKAPKLHSIKAEIMQDADLDALIELIDRSDCLITSLEVELWISAGDVFFVALDQAPKLKHLSIRFMTTNAKGECQRVAEEIEERIIGGPHSYCPVLETISLSWRNGQYLVPEDADDDKERDDAEEDFWTQMFYMARERRTPAENQRLVFKELTLVEFGRPSWKQSENVKGYFQELKNKGLKLTIQHQRYPYNVDIAA